MTTLTEKSILEEEMLKALNSTFIEAPYENEQFTEREAKACAEVAKRYIEKAIVEFSNHEKLTGLDLRKHLTKKAEFLTSLFPNKEEQV